MVHFLNNRWVEHLPEINTREIFVLVPLIVFILAIGIWPGWILEIINRKRGSHDALLTE